MADEKPEHFIDTAKPQKIGGTYYLRLSVKSKLKAAIARLNEPILLYDEIWCEHHGGYHIFVRLPDEPLPKLDCVSLPKPKKEESTHYTF